ENHHGHGNVDQGYLDAVDLLDQLAGRQELAGLGADDIHEVQPDGSGGAGHAGNRGVAFIDHAIGIGLDDGFDAAVGVDVENGDRRFRAGHRDHAALDGEGPDSGEDVAAGGGGVHERFGHRDLGEEVID